jgi:hypothetical protein
MVLDKKSPYNDIFRVDILTPKIEYISTLYIGKITLNRQCMYVLFSLGFRVKILLICDKAMANWLLAMVSPNMGRFSRPGRQVFYTVYFSLNCLVTLNPPNQNYLSCYALCENLSSVYIRIHDMKKRKHYKYSIQVRKKLTWFVSLNFSFSKMRIH